MLMPPRLDDAAWLDAQYNNRARVADAMTHLAQWAKASALARERSARKLLDVHYGDGPGETLDVFPAAAPNAPVLIYIHGGYWRTLDKSDFSFVAPSFVADGAMVVVPNYALCPAVSIEDIALQMVAAVAWTWRHAAAHGGNPERIAIVGHSAGAHLAAMLLSCRWKQVDEALPLYPLTGALAISGLYDLEPVRRTEFLQGDLRLTPATSG
jgi:arylformamidase